MTQDLELARVIAALERTYNAALLTRAAAYAAERVSDAAALAIGASAPGGAAAYKIARADYEAIFVAADAAWNAGDVLKAARTYSTLADLLACDRSDVRLAAQLALAMEPTVTAPVARRRTR